MSVETRGRTASYQGAAPLKALHRDRPGIGTGMFEHDVGAMTAGDLADLLENIVLLTVEQVFSAQPATEFKLVVARSHRDWMRVVEFGDLQRPYAESPRRAPYEDEIASLDVRARDQHTPYCDQHERHGCGFFEAQIRRLGGGVAGRGFQIPAWGPDKRPARETQI